MPRRRRTQLLRRDAAGRQIVAHRGLDVAVPEVLAETEPLRKLEHHIDVGACLAFRWNDGRAQLHPFGG